MPVPTLGYQLGRTEHSTDITAGPRTGATETRSATETAPCPNPGCRQSLVRTVAPGEPWRIAP